jgi:LysR family glycine cleavage system transcriptional activator
MVCHRLLSGRLVPICNPALLRSKPLASVDDLKHHTLLHSLVFPDSWAKWLAMEGRPDITGLHSISFGSSSLTYQAAMEGIGVALGRTVLIREDVVAGRLIVPVEQALEDGSAYFLAYRTTASRKALLLPFLEWLMGEASCDDHH